MTFLSCVCHFSTNKIQLKFQKLNIILRKISKWFKISSGWINEDKRLLSFFKRKLFIFTWNQRYRPSEEETEKQRTSIHCFIPHMAIMARPGPCWRQEPGVSPGSPTWMQGTKVLDRLPLPSEAIGRELDLKRKCREWNWHLYLNNGTTGWGIACRVAPWP